jgi:predicted transposase/invertase (TIGR01784 family)
MADGDELKRDGRNFALPVLTAKRMLEAGGTSSKREEYSLEILELIKARKLDDKKAWTFQKFAYRLLQIDKDDIDPKIKGVWKMQFRPIDEVVREIHIRDAEEYGMAKGIEKGMEKGMEKGVEKVARSMLADGLPAETIRKYTGLDESSILSLR